MSSRRALLGIAACTAFSIPCVWGQAPSSCAIPEYSLVAVPMRPAAINDAGQVAGTTPAHRAAVWSAKTGLRELPLPAGFFHSEALGINNQGHVVGIAYDQSFNIHQPFAFANGVATLLAGVKARAYHINESDEIAGESILPGRGKSEPVLWTGNSMHSLGGCCGGSTKSINEHGQAIGDAYDDHGRYYAYLWTQSGGLLRIGPPDHYSSAIAINSAGHVVIQTFPNTFLYAAGSLIPLKLSPKFPSHPHAINDCDVIVGSYGAFSDADRAFVWEKTAGFQDLNTRISAAAGWKLESATGINNLGAIVGKGDSSGGEDGGFMLIPKP